MALDREARKKWHKVWVIVSSLLMVLAVVLIVAITTLLSLGYSYNGEVFQQTGTLQLHTTPTGATVAIDGATEFLRSNLSVDGLAPGEHTVTLTRDGYDTWEGTARIHSGYVLRLYYPRLFLTERESEAVLELGGDLAFYAVAPSGQAILYAEANTAVWHYIDASGSKLSATELALSEVFDEDFWTTTADGIRTFTGRASVKSWDEAGSHLLATVKTADRTDWFLFNLKDFSASVNLSAEFGLDFDTIAIAGDAADRLFALENGNLRQITLGSLEISRVLLSDIESFANLGANVAYVQNLDGERNVGTFSAGDSGGVRIVEVNAEISGEAESNADGTEDSAAIAEDWGDQTRVLVLVSKYYGDVYLAVVSGQHVRFYGGTFPAYGAEAKISENLPLLAEYTLAFTPDRAEVSPDGQFFLFAASTEVAVLDAYDNYLSVYTAAGSGFFWFDDGMLGAVRDGALSVWDCDGANLRILATDATTFPALASENGKYVYYVATGTKTTDAEAEGATSASAKSGLTLMRLQVSN